MHLPEIDALTAATVVFATAATDAIYVRFTSAVVARRRIGAANWSALWYLLSSYAVINYTSNWAYVAFAAIGSWIGAFVSLSAMWRPSGGRWGWLTGQGAAGQGEAPRERDENETPKGG